MGTCWKWAPCASLISILALAFLAPASVSADATIYANEDCFTSQAATGTVYNNQGLLVKSQIGSRRYTWVEFTLGTTAVQSATLNLYLDSIPSGWGTSHTVVIAAAEYDLNETTLKWSNQPDTSSWAVMTGWTASAVGQYYSAVITSFYNANLGKTVTFKVYQTDSNSVGGSYEDSEGSKLTTNYPYIFAQGEAGDTEPPTTPANLAAEACCSAVKLTWTASTDNVGVGGYKVKRNGTQIGTTTGTLYNDFSGVTASTSYSYEVIAYDDAGNNSVPATVPVQTPSCYSGNEIVFDFDDRPNGEVHLWNNEPQFYTKAEGAAGVGHWFGKRNLGTDGTVYWSAPNSVNNYRYEFGLSGQDGSLTLRTATPIDQGGEQNAVTSISSSDFGSWFKWTLDGDYRRGMSVELDMNIVGDLHGWCAPWGPVPGVDGCGWTLDYGHQGSDWGTQWGDRATVYFSLAKSMTLPDPPHANGNTGNGVAYWFAVQPNNVGDPDDDRIRVFSDSGNTEHARFRLLDGLGLGLTPENGEASGCGNGGTPYARNGVIEGDCNHVVLKVAACSAGGNSEYWDIWITRPNGQTLHINPATAEKVSGDSNLDFGSAGHTMKTTYENKDSSLNTLRLGNTTPNMIWGTKYNHVKIRNDWDGDISVHVGSIGQLRALAPGTPVVIDSIGGEKIVTTRTTTFDYNPPFQIYIEQEDRSAGIRLDCADNPGNDVRGQQVSNLLGVLMVDSDGNPYLNVISGALQLAPGTKTVAPVGMTNKATAGAAATGGAGLTNVGMLATIWGRVISCEMDEQFNPYYVIDDGSSTFVTVRDYGFDGTASEAPLCDEYWMFTGAVALTSDGSGGYTRTLILEGDSARRLQQ